MSVIHTPPLVKPAGLVSASELEAMTLPELTFIVEGILPAGLALLVSKPKIGKSFMSLGLGLAVARGEPFLGRATLQGDVLYYALEDNHRRIKRRLRMLGGPAALPSNLHFAVEAEAINGGLQDEIKAWIDWADLPRLVVIDTMARVMPEAKANQSEYDHTTQVLGKLQRFALDRDVLILLVHHSNKNQQADDVFDRVLGSTGINGVMDTMLVLSRQRGQLDAKLSVTSRDVEEIEEDIQRTPDGGWQLLAAPLTDKLGVTSERLDVMTAIAAGYTRTSEIASLLGKSDSTVSEQLDALQEKGHVVNVSWGRYGLSTTAAGLISAEAETPETSETAPEESVQFEFDDTFPETVETESAPKVGSEPEQHEGREEEI